MSPQVFQILLSLLDGPLHGYAIIQDVATRTNDEIRLTASTLYDALSRLVDQGWIAEVESPAARVDGHDGRRRYYQLTPHGKAAAEGEAARLERALDTARAKKLLTR